MTNVPADLMAIFAKFSVFEELNSLVSFDADLTHRPSR